MFCAFLFAFRGDELLSAIYALPAFWGDELLSVLSEFRDEELGQFPPMRWLLLRKH